jgi:hypothetical protein
MTFFFVAPLKTVRPFARLCSYTHDVILRFRLLSLFQFKTLANSYHAGLCLSVAKGLKQRMSTFVAPKFITCVPSLTQSQGMGINTRNQESLYWRGPAAIYPTLQRMSRNKTGVQFTDPAPLYRGVYCGKETRPSLSRRRAIAAKLRTLLIHSSPYRPDRLWGPPNLL